MSSVRMMQRWHINSAAAAAGGGGGGWGRLLFLCLLFHKNIFITWQSIEGTCWSLSQWQALFYRLCCCLLEKWPLIISLLLSYDVSGVSNTRMVSGWCKSDCLVVKKKKTRKQSFLSSVWLTRRLIIIDLEIINQRGDWRERKRIIFFI